MAKSWIKCAKSGHTIAEGWTDEPQRRKDGQVFVSHVCGSCGVLWVELIPAEAISAILGPGGGIIS